MQDLSPQHFAPLRPPSHSAQRKPRRFSVPRIIRWISIGTHLPGLAAMFFLFGVFGVPLSFGWGAFVILFVFDSLLSQPRTPDSGSAVSLASAAVHFPKVH